MPQLIDEYPQTARPPTDQWRSAAPHPPAATNSPIWDAALLDRATHDLCNTLAVIQCNAQLIRNQVAKADPLICTQVAARLADLDAAVLRLGAQIAQLGSGPACDKIDLVALARRSAASYQPIEGATCIHVESNAAQIIGFWDGVGLARIFDNLLSNAVKYSPAGAAINIHIRSDQDADGAWAIVRICDHGIGIPPEDLPYVFAPHYRATNVPPNVPGSGLGLASVQRLILAEGGTITVRSRVNAGTCFSIHLPLHRSAAHPAAEGL